MASFAHSFYRSRQWERCRAAYIERVGGLCEECLRRGLYTVGTQVHHKVRLTPDNINDPRVTLSFDNLELLCRSCHDKRHEIRHWRTDPDGHVLLSDPTDPRQVSAK